MTTNELRARLAGLVGMVPASVMAGSYQTAVSWKKVAHEACRVTENKKATQGQLAKAHEALVAFYSPIEVAKATKGAA